MPYTMGDGYSVKYRYISKRYPLFNSAADPLVYELVKYNCTNVKCNASKCRCGSKGFYPGGRMKTGLLPSQQTCLTFR